MITTSVMIPTATGGFAHLARLLPGLALECKENSAEILIIDNASRDGTTNYLNNYDCTVIINKINHGFAHAHNQAARKAEGEYLLLLNNDTVITPKFLPEMIKTFSLDSKIGIVGCLLYRLRDKAVQHAGVMFTTDYVPYELGLEIPGINPGIPKSDWRVHSVREVPSVTAACMLVKKSIWLEVGGMDENYRNGWEDTDFVLKVKEKGYKVFYTGKTNVYHEHYGSKAIGRFAHEKANRLRYDQLWVMSGRAKQILGDFREA